MGLGHVGQPDCSQAFRMTARRRKVSVALIDPLALRRASIASMLKSAGPDFVVSSFPGVPDLTADASTRGPVDVVLFNVGTARISDEIYHDTLYTLAAELGSVPVVLLVDQATAEDMVSAVHLGVRGVIPTTMEPAVAIQALWLVVAGGIFLPATALIDHFDGHVSGGRSTPTTHGGGGPTLTQREEQVLARVREGKPNKIIAHELKLRQGTVKVYVRHLMRKLGVSNRTQAALRADMRTGQATKSGDAPQHETENSRGRAAP